MKFTGWRLLELEEKLQIGDKFVWISDNCQPANKFNIHPESSVACVKRDAAGSTVRSFIYPFSQWAAYRRDGPVKFTIDSYFSTPLPLP